MKDSIHKQAKDAEKIILEENDDFYERITRDRYPVKRTPSGILMLRVSCSVVAAVVLIVCVAVFMTLRNEKKVLYLSQNEVMEPSDVNELKSKINIDFEADKNKYEIGVKRVYDSVSKDDLYFKVTLVCNDLLENILIEIYINPDYPQIKNLSVEGEIIESKINDYTLEYQENISEDSGLYYFNYLAQIDMQNTVIYIEYEQTWFEKPSNFFHFVEQTIGYKSGS